jgi:hypothetical protein
MFFPLLTSLSSLRKTSSRLDETCLALSRWIDLSNSIAFRVLGSAHTSVAQAQALGTISPLGLLSTPSSPTEKQRALDESKRQKAPLIASVAVSCRAELFHDLLSAQISATSGRACCDTIFANQSVWTEMDESAGRGGDEGERASIHRSSEYVFTTEDQITLLEILCTLVTSLGQEVEKSSKSAIAASPSSAASSSNLSVLQTVRQNIRFHAFQYVLGLDERWSFTQTVGICSTILSLLERYRPLLGPTTAGPGGSSSLLLSMLPFTLSGKRRSQLLTPSSLNILARALPKTLVGKTCRVRYSLQQDGASVSTLLNHSDQAPYSSCLLVVQDSAGYIFGGYLDERIRSDFSKQYFGTGGCFVFRILPNTKIYSWTKRSSSTSTPVSCSLSLLSLTLSLSLSPSLSYRNEYFFCYGASEFIGMGGGGNGGSGGFAFVLDDDLRGGTSTVSATFDNDILAFTSLFECNQVELLTFESEL